MMSSGHRHTELCSISHPIPAVSRLPIGSSTSPSVSSAIPAVCRPTSPGWYSLTP
ncbi:MULTISPECIES: hypothetical protein [Amycolatopsis]|uniref:hypothetical protein n=1 Tax=Amycolatopsis TaxID=1813 RepID=UPI0013044212|nr:MULTISPECIES: hypothetical protein [Amycolatopsis]